MTSNDAGSRTDSGAWIDEDALESGRVRVHRLPFRAQPAEPEYEVYVVGESVAMGGDRCLIPTDVDRRAPIAPETMPR